MSSQQLYECIHPLPRFLHRVESLSLVAHRCMRPACMPSECITQSAPKGSEPHPYSPQVERHLSPPVKPRMHVPCGPNPKLSLAYSGAQRCIAESKPRQYALTYSIVRNSAQPTLGLTRCLGLRLRVRYLIYHPSEL